MDDDLLGQDDLMRLGRLTWDKEEAVIAGWVKFVERLHADTFSTITFDAKKCGFALSGQNAVDRSVWVMNRVAKSVKRPLPSFVVAEEHRNGGTFHVHGLHRIGGLGDEMDWMLRTALWKVAFAKYGRNEFRSIDSVGGVRGYVCKYVVKRRADWAILSPQEWRET